MRYLRVALCVWAAVFVALEYRRESTHEEKLRRWMRKVNEEYPS